MNSSFDELLNSVFTIHERSSTVQAIENMKTPSFMGLEICALVPNDLGNVKSLSNSCLLIWI